MTNPSRPTAVVTGATGGIGAAIAVELARTHDVWLVGRDARRLASVAASAEGMRTWQVDFACAENDLVVPPDLTSVDILVLSAGLWTFGSVANASYAEWRDVFAVNVFGQVALTRVLLPALRTAHGRVLVVNSTALLGAPGQRSVYTASKAALKVFADALHQEERANGVQVTSIYPGRVATRMQEEVTQSEGGKYTPDQYLSPLVMAQTVRDVVQLGQRAHIAEIVIRPTYPAAT